MITQEQWDSLQKGSVLITTTGKEREVIRMMGREVEIYSPYGNCGRVFKSLGDIKNKWSVKEQ